MIYEDCWPIIGQINVVVFQRRSKAYGRDDVVGKRWRLLSQHWRKTRRAIKKDKSLNYYKSELTQNSKTQEKNSYSNTF
jgi:hypothetical protein